MPMQPDQPPSLPSASEAEAARLTARRRFACAGLAAPIILGTLASKPVLGQTGAPYNCTISGQVSGNVSGPADVNCATLGFTPAHWAGTESWPLGFARGGTPNGNCSLAEGRTLRARRSARRSDKPSHTARRAPPHSARYCLHHSRLSGSPEQCHNVSGAAHEPVASEDMVLGRQAVASLLNAYQNPSTYPLTATAVVNLFNEVWQTGSFQFNSTTTWTRTQVIFYLASLNGTS